MSFPEKAFPEKKSFFKRYRLPLLLLGLLFSAALYAFSRVALSPDTDLPEETIPQADGHTLLHISFTEPASLKGWRAYTFNGKSNYEVEKDRSGQMALHASSKSAYSALFKIVNIPLSAQPQLSWEWRVVKFPSNKKSPDLGADGENDFALRICAIFGKNNPFNTDVIQYIWDDRFPEGTSAPSPYDKNVRMLVVHSGLPASPEGWVKETRDIAQDYEKLFGKKSFDHFRAVAIMANSDDTRTESDAWLKEIRVETPPGVHYQPKRPRRGIKGAFKKIYHGANKVRHKIPVPKIPLPKHEHTAQAEPSPA